MLDKMFKKGYKNDAGFDIIIDEHVVFPPKQISIYELKHTITPRKNTCAMLIARTSAAKKGLIISMCPIDTDYTGKITAIVYNASDERISYEPGQAFCQAVFVKLSRYTIKKNRYVIAKKGKRGKNKFGSTG